jgi:hypothetical protein
MPNARATRSAMTNKPDDQIIEQSTASKAAWIFGSGLILFLIGVFISGPCLTGLRRTLLLFFMSLTAGLFAFFFLGGIVLKSNLKGVIISASGGVALFVLIFFYAPLPALERCVETPLSANPTPTPTVATPTATATPIAPTPTRPPSTPIGLSTQRPVPTPEKDSEKAVTEENALWNAIKASVVESYPQGTTIQGIEKVSALICPNECSLKVKVTTGDSGDKQSSEVITVACQRVGGKFHCHK